MSDKQEIEVNEHLRVILIKEMDDDYDPDYLGTFGSRVQEWCIDRSLQVLLGQAVEAPQWSDRQEELEDMLDSGAMSSDPEIYFADTPEYEELQKLREEYDVLYEEWDKYHGLKVLSDDVYVYHRYDCGREHRFYYMSENYTDETEENKVKYMLQDHKRYEHLFDGYWYYMGFIVKVLVSGQEVAEASVWGIESDGGREFHNEVWGDLIGECFSNIRTKVNVQMDLLQEQIFELKAGLQKLPENFEEIEQMILKEVD